MDITTVSDSSLIDKLCALCHMRGERQALADQIDIDMDVQIQTGKNEILRRLSITNPIKE